MLQREMKKQRESPCCLKNSETQIKAERLRREAQAEKAAVV